MSDCSVCLVEHDPEIHEATLRVRAYLRPYEPPVKHLKKSVFTDGGMSTASGQLLMKIKCRDCNDDVDAESRQTVRCVACQIKYDSLARRKAADKHQAKRKKKPVLANG